MLQHPYFPLDRQQDPPYPVRSVNAPKKSENGLFHSAFSFHLARALRDISSPSPDVVILYIFAPMYVLGMYTRFYGLFYVKKKVSAKTLLIFIFYCGTVSRETGEKMTVFL